MTTSNLEIKIIQKINIIAGKMIEEGISVSLALSLSKYASSDILSGNNRDHFFLLMSEWDKEVDFDKKSKLILNLSELLVRTRLKNLSKIDKVL